MVYLLLICQIILALVFLLSATSKMFYPKQFIIALQFSNIPTLIVYPVATLTVGSEITLALSLFFNTPVSLLAALPGTLILLGIFTSWLILMRWKKISVRCGCFGQSKSDISIGNILRNIIFIGIALFASFLSFILHITSIPFPQTWWMLTLSLIVIGLYVSVMAKHLYRITGSRQRSSTFNMA